MTWNGMGTVRERLRWSSVAGNGCSKDEELGNWSRIVVVFRND